MIFSVEAERLVDEVDVVVDRLGHADDRDLQPAALRLVPDAVRALERAVAADQEQDVDPLAIEHVDGDDRVLLAARGAQDRAGDAVDALDHVLREDDRMERVPGIQRAVAVAQTEHRLHAVAVEQLEVERADDVVQPWRETAARHDRGARVTGPEVDFLARARFLERGARLRLAVDRLLDRDADPDAVRDVAADACTGRHRQAQGRVDEAFAERLYLVRRVVHSRQCTSWQLPAARFPLEAASGECCSQISCGKFELEPLRIQLPAPRAG
jgi:hypothetical protein